MFLSVVVFTLVGVLAVSLLSKLTSSRAFNDFVEGVAILAGVRRATARILATTAASCEFIVAAGLLFRSTRGGALAAAAALFAVFTVVIARAVRAGRKTSCHCFGASSEDVAWRHVGRTLLLAVGAAAAWAVARSTNPDTVSANTETVVALAIAAVLTTALVAIDHLAWLFGARTPAPPRPR